ncbi:MAG: 1-deoxy-D-xylulose-5-phosphate reductoisomerase [Endomicrobiia bacterium]
MKKNLVILGSTGSIGIQTLSIVRNYINKFNIIGLSAYSNINILKKQIKEFNPEYVCVGKEIDITEIKKSFSNKKLKIYSGIQGLEILSSIPSADTIVIAVVGAVGIYPLVSALKSGKKIALANKESLIIAGDIIKKLIPCSSSLIDHIIPVDSEHSAIFQCIKNESKKSIRKIIITGSGGPFFQKHIDRKKITIEDALKHPKWKMGKKITIDSATLINKGLEIMEAHYLFDIPYEKIKLLIHPQAIVHSMVEFTDGAVIGLLSEPDMRLSIQYALTYPERLKTGIKFLQLEKIKHLTFFAPDYNKLPCLKLALESAKIGHTMPAVLNASNEVAVESFLKNQIKFSDISKIIKNVMAKHKLIKNPELQDIIQTDAWAREEARKEVLKCS